MKPLPRLLAITPGDHGRARDLQEWLRPLGEAGLPGVLIREPGIDAAETRALAREAVRWIPFVIVHDRCAGARATGLPLHLGESAVAEPIGGTDPGRSLLRNRDDLPQGVRFGVSCHSREALDLAFGAGASWALLSPVWSPGSKPGDTRPTLGLERFVRWAAGRPVFALGGIDAERLVELRRAGAHGAALIGALFGRPSPREGAEAVRELVAAASTPPGRHSA